MSIVRDTFTEGSDTDLPSHTPDTGGTWTDGGTWTVVAATDELNSGANDYARNSTTPSSANYSVWVNGRTVTTGGNDQFGSACRRTDFGKGNASANGYAAYIQGTGNLLLVKEVAGTTTQLGSSYAIPSFAATTQYEVKVQADGDAISAILDGTERVAATDTAVTTANLVGIYMRGVGGTANCLITLLDSDYTAAASTVGHLVGGSLLNSRLTRSILI